MERIVIDTAQLQGTVSGLDEDIRALQQQATDLLGIVNELNAMWTGPAHDALANRFQQDFETVVDQLEELAAYNESLADARTSYNNCDDWVRNAIAAIRI